MKGWAELKEAFCASVEGGPDEQARQIAQLASIDPELPRRLEALLAADASGEPLLQIFQSDPVASGRPARIGTYDVVGVLGAGGMGEVYRARDTRLERDVALKVLPPAVATDQERLARFKREAQVLASLNHPHIAQVYGLEESGSAPAMVMELVKGPTLAMLIASYPKNPLPIARVLAIARQIADGLDAAHEKGIVHRDLKPSNVALTSAGDAKILDFGVAKSLGDSPSNQANASDLTGVGVVLGTPAYMSPEQARGQLVDKRTDIWAFGCLVYELLTGRQPFQGKTASDSLAAVLEHEPDMAALPPETPAAVRSMLRHCLEKEPRLRLRDIGDARLTIDDALRATGQRRASGSPVDEPTRVRHPWLTPALWTLGGFSMAAAAAIGLTTVVKQSSPVAEPRRVISSIVFPRGLQLSGGDLEARGSEARFAVSPDGRKVALVAADQTGRIRLWIRDLASAAFQPIPETEGGTFPFWSPDSESVGFVADGKLKAIRLTSGTAITISEAGFRTGSWGRDGLILFAPRGSSPLYVVPSTGGQPRPATTLDKTMGEVQHGYPCFLPDGRHFLYFSMGSAERGVLDSRGTYVASLDEPHRAKLLLAGATQARYANGHLLFVQNGTLRAQPFDTGSMELRGVSFPLVEDLKLTTVGATGATAAYSVSDTDVLAYQAALRTESRPMSFDRAGKQLAVLGATADYSDVAIAPDGIHLAVSVMDPARSTRDLWLYDTTSGRGQRFTFDPGDEFAPVWSPDGTRMLFSTMTRGLVDLRLKDVSRIGDPVPLVVDKLGLGRYAMDWSRDGRFIIYIGGGRAIAMSDLWVAPVEHPDQAHPLLDSAFVETHGHLAPRGDWFVYASNETGRLEVYVDRFPQRGAKRLVSTAGGAWPRWSRDGTEIFYMSTDNQLMSVSSHATPGQLEIGLPRALFVTRPRPPARLDAYAYDVWPDSKRFVVNTLMEDPASSSITIVLNWRSSQKP